MPTSVASSTTKSVALDPSQSVDTSQTVESTSTKPSALGFADNMAQVVSDEESCEKPPNRKRRCSNEREAIETHTISKPLPDVNEAVSPDDFMLKLVEAQYGFKFEAKLAMSLDDFFSVASEEQMAAYNNDVVSAVRNDDLDHLKRLHAGGQLMDCFNRFGESLLNTACRRGFESIVRYLMDQPNASIRHRDDCGRTPLHDACWHPSPQLTICKWILETDPVLFFIADKRGCTAFQYARPEHWPIWRKFLLDNRESLVGLTNPDIQSILTKD